LHPETVIYKLRTKRSSTAYCHGKQMKDTDRVMQSFGRCCRNEHFFDDFYVNFRATSPVIRDMFTNTDMTTQKNLLRAGILNLVLYARGMPDTKLKALGQSHSRSGLNIQPELYDLWLQALQQTIIAHDPSLSPEDQQAWRAVLNKGIDVIKSYY
jgi:hemoglobin-like flavoprotein